MSQPRAVLYALTLALVPSVVGCGGETADPKQSLDQQANAKVEAMRQLADAVGRNAPPGELDGLVEAFVSNTMDAKAHPDEAKQVVEIYTAKVKGKLTGARASQVKTAIDGIESSLKK